MVVPVSATLRHEPKASNPKQLALARLANDEELLAPEVGFGSAGLRFAARKQLAPWYWEMRNPLEGKL
jgi:hypothetical protein